MITLNILPNKDLEIVLNDKEELETILEKATNTDEIISELLDGGRYLGNNWFDATYQIGLTDAPAISFGEIEEVCNEKVWYFQNYMLESFAETLLETRKVIFTKIN